MDKHHTSNKPPPVQQAAQPSQAAPMDDFDGKRFDSLFSGD